MAMVDHQAPVQEHPADRPRNQACPGFPYACIEPFHYNNPVTGRETK